MQARVHTNSTGRRVADKGLTGALPATRPPPPLCLARTHCFFPCSPAEETSSRTDLIRIFLFRREISEGEEEG